MAKYTGNIPDNPARELLTEYLEGLAPYADSRSFDSHEPGSGNYWKAIDLVHVALHLSGVRVWATDSYSDGASVAVDRSDAERYVGRVDFLTTDTLRCVQPFARVSFMANRLLVGLSPRIEAYTKPATHPSNIGSGELTATSMRLSDIDPASRDVIGEVFQLPPDYDTEFVYNGLNSNANDIVGTWYQDNETTLALPKPEPRTPASTSPWTGVELVIPPQPFQ